MSATLFQGKSIRVESLGDGLAELCFDRENDGINKLDKRTVAELGQAVAVIEQDETIRGALVSSAKDVFIVGADITEFGAMFQLTADEIAVFNGVQNRVFTALETLRVPSVVAINGFALGGGLECALACDFRVMSATAQVGLPEVKLGLFPGFGGTVRLPRVANAQVAIDWIASGAPSKAEAARAAGVVDEITAPEALREAALKLLRKAVAGEADWKSRRATKDSALPLSVEHAGALFAAGREKVAKQSPKHQPAALAAVEVMEAAASQGREGALLLEARGFGAICKTQAASSLVQIFLNDQVLKKKFKAHARNARPLKQAAVLGAGIMGGGIAYTSALRGTPVLMKDIQQKQLDLGTGEAQKLLVRQVKSGRLKQETADAVLASIRPQLDYAGFEQVDAVVEAVVESIKVKHAVLTELENVLRDDAVIASNTSSLRIDDLAAPLKRPENFVGMHFFNPVPMMPLVEVIRGSCTSDVAASTIVGYGVAMGKTPIVVKDCPGFLVNRILTPYMLAFSHLVADGADFVAVDQAMEAFGWPMGPAYLNDVIGLDTAVHVNRIISDGYPDRMKWTWAYSGELLVNMGRLGQKNGFGYYRYETDPAGKPKKRVAADTYELLKAVQPNGKRDFSAQEIVDRMMLPLIVEGARALEDGIVGSAIELDMALLLGLGLPQYLGGVLKYADWLGLDRVVSLSDRYAVLGPMYQVPQKLREMAARGERYYP
ncbi:MAG: fatty acid oxidation complex subunit alpha FadB [Hydrocarboniphaga sp.]|uniref:fatty acid oxidation complex subunit alpha FadB n=1 Tax=Hydrocarboniphaga sp. TaxID=2033016 RepID=UPI0026379641|nr:fatty acid oxidation complex subunit alpha FadB [Hydrocarboniphaga sp.]MDB5967723.1 fatty acid oxidation complex subunit alpha FadB [Hydrocarboniphaga sp.]